MDTLIQYALRFVGTKYKWGGSNPINGFDCSGLVQEILKAAGNCPPGDSTAQSLYNYFENTPGSQFGIFSAGCLAFYGQDMLHITHVTFCISPQLAVGADGGDHLTLTIDDAASKDAFVKVRPIKYRKDFLTTVKPSYACMGLM